MPHYSVTRPIPSCIVTKKLLTQIEAELLGFLQIQHGAKFDTKYYSISVATEYSETRYTSINDYKPNTFPDDIKSVKMSYPILAITIQFSVGGPYMHQSEIRVHELETDSPQSIDAWINGIVEQLNLERYPYLVRHRDSATALVLTIVSALVGALCLTQAFFPEHPPLVKYIALFLGTAGLLVFVFMCLCWMQPYCFFDCLRHNKRREDLRHWTRWLFGSIIAIAMLKPLYDFLIK